ncbi:hypothetical protein M758_2G015200 [Ceratodon purpureus]|nr:hypothetical protein M758_2G015200 [Ceratodon purpureus]
MAEVLGADFKCCSMCSRHCFETHGDFGRKEAQKLLSVPSFFSLIKRSHIEGSKYLRIPVSFYEDWKNNIGRTLDLKGPWGFKCRVTAERHSHGYVLRTGFKPFLDHHKIDAGDSLVFYLLDESIFSVKVYDKRGSEKKDPPTAAEQEDDPTEDSDGEGSDEKAVDRMLKLQQKKLGKKKVGVRSRKGANEFSRSNQREGSLSCNPPAASLAQEENRVDVYPVSESLGADDKKQHVSSRKLRSAQKRKLSATPGSYSSEESENEHDEPSNSQRDEAKMRQAKDVDHLIEKLGKKSQAVVLTISHVKNHRVYLGKIQHLLPEAETYVTLVDERDEHYNVKWSVTKKNSRSRLSTGWNQIVVDHKLVVGDVCVFESMNHFLIKLHIFPLAKYHTGTDHPAFQNFLSAEIVQTDGGLKVAP